MMTSLDVLEEIIPPIQLIYVSKENNKIFFKVNQEALKILEKNKIEKCCVVGISGKERLGKSFIMNRLFKEFKFKLGYTTKSVTKGIWIWAKRIKGVIDGEVNPVVIFLDTEGLSNVANDINYDNKIICLTIMLSSLFLYNTNNVIDSQAIEKLSFVSQLKKLLQTNLNFFDFSPIFIWLLRDLNLIKEANGKKDVSDKEYFDSIFNVEDKKNLSNLDKSKEEIKKSFPVREIFCFPPPNNEGYNLQDLEKEEIGKEGGKAVKKSFDEKMGELANYLKNGGMKIKKLGNSHLQHSLTIGDFSQMLEKYVQSINNDFLNVEETFSYVKTQHNNSLVEELEKRFKENLCDDLEKMLPVCNVILEEKLKKAHSDVSKIFEERIMEDETDNKIVEKDGKHKIIPSEVRQIFEKKKNDIESVFIEKNKKLSREKTSKFLEIEFETLKEILKKAYEKKEEVDIIVFDFEETTKSKLMEKKNFGPEEVLLETFNEKKEKFFEYMITFLVSEKAISEQKEKTLNEKKKSEEAKNRLEEKEKELEVARKRVQNEKNRRVEQILEFEKNFQKKKKDCEENFKQKINKMKEDEENSMKKELKKNNKFYKIQKETLQKNHQDMMKILESETQCLRTQVNNLENEISSIQSSGGGGGGGCTIL